MTRTRCTLPMTRGLNSWRAGRDCAPARPSCIGALLLCAVASACSLTDVRSLVFACTDGSQCVPGFSCINGRCQVLASDSGVAGGDSGMNADGGANEIDGGLATDAGCNSATCSGCCDSSGTCQSGLSYDACGFNGQACWHCPTSTDTCVGAGACTCGTIGACVGDSICMSGTCLCSPTCSGCCDTLGCEPGYGYFSSNSACGAGGIACTTCDAGLQCNCGVCSSVGCSGCCTANAGCVGGTSALACGEGGSACVSCSTGEVCQNGRCCLPSGAACDAGSACCRGSCRGTCQ
jgi:hypothetical protein